MVRGGWCRASGGSGPAERLYLADITKLGELVGAGTPDDSLSKLKDSHCAKLGLLGREGRLRRALQGSLGVGLAMTVGLRVRKESILLSTLCVFTKTYGHIGHWDQLSHFTRG